MHLNQIRLMLYHERERENKKNANFVYIVYLLTKLMNIFDEAFFIDVSICISALLSIEISTHILRYEYFYCTGQMIVMTQTHWYLPLLLIFSTLKCKWYIPNVVVELLM